MQGINVSAQEAVKAWEGGLSEAGPRVTRDTSEIRGHVKFKGNGLNM